MYKKDKSRQDRGDERETKRREEQIGGRTGGAELKRTDVRGRRQKVCVCTRPNSEVVGVP
jgi:hypothetical protein